MDRCSASLRLGRQLVAYKQHCISQVRAGCVRTVKYKNKTPLLADATLLADSPAIGCFVRKRLCTQVHNFPSLGGKFYFL
jgi:hypothetical protein